MTTTLAALLAPHDANAPAVGAPGRDWLSYGALRTLAVDVTEQLRGFGISAEDRVAIVLPNGPEMATAFVTIAQGAVTAPLNPAYTHEEYAFYLGDLRAKPKPTARDKCRDQTPLAQPSRGRRHIAILRRMLTSGRMSSPVPATPENPSTVPAGRPEICVVANAKSGATARVAALLKSAMAEFGDLAELRTFTGDPTPVAEQAIRDGFSIIVAAGGDGTVAGIAHALAGTSASMGVLPLGTFNYFARGLDVPTDAVEAVAAITEGQPHDIAVGSVNGKVFLNNVALGLYPAILDEREAAYQRWGRSRIMAHWSTLRTLFRMQRPMRVRIVADGQEQIRRSPMIFVARSAYQLDQFGVVGAKAISDDRFAVYIARQTTRSGLLKLAWRLMRPGKVDLSDDLELLTPQTLEIDWPKRRRIRIAYDGEREKMKLPLTFRIDHQVLSVILPPTKAASVKGSE